MTTSPAGSGHIPVLRVLHGLLVAGVALALVVVGVARSVVALPDPPAPLERLVAIVGAVMLAGLVVVRSVLRRRIVPLAPGGDEDAWAETHRGPVIVLWAMAEGVAMLGAIVWLLTGRTAMLVIVSGIGLLLLVLDRPARLMGR